MAWADVETIEGVDLEAYDKVGAELGDEPGALLHVARRFDGKLRVIEVWESEQAPRRIRDERLPAAFETVVGPEGVRGERPPPGLEPMDVRGPLSGARRSNDAASGRA